MTEPVMTKDATTLPTSDERPQLTEASEQPKPQAFDGQEVPTSTNVADEETGAKVGDHEDGTIVADDDDQQPPLSRRKRMGICCYKYRWWIAGILIAALVIYVAKDSSPSGNGYIRNGLTDTLRWMQRHKWAGVFVFIGLYFVVTLLFIPAIMMSFAAGYVFGHEFSLGVGIGIGTLSSFLGALASAMVAFFIARHFLYDWVQGLVAKNNFFTTLNKVLAGDKGFRVMALMRLSPIIPFTLTNYVAGTTALTAKSFFWSNFFLLPAMIVIVFLGASTGNLTANGSNSTDSKQQQRARYVGIAVAFLAILLSAYFVKKEMDKVVAEQTAEEGAGENKNEDEEKGPSDPSNIVEGNQQEKEEEATKAHLTTEIKAEDDDVGIGSTEDHQVTKEEVENKEESSNTKWFYFF